MWLIPIDMKKNTILVLSLLLYTMVFRASGQISTRVVGGQIQIADGSITPGEKNHSALAVQLDRKIKSDPRDTIALFDRALLYLQYNSLLAKPYPDDKAALANLSNAKEIAEKAISLHMQNFKLKVLRAQIYKELCYRFAGDESWKYSAGQIAQRRLQFNNYKDLANKYYNELKQLDSSNAYAYEKLKIRSKYPL